MKGFTMKKRITLLLMLVALVSGNIFCMKRKRSFDPPNPLSPHRDEKTTALIENEV